MTSEVNNSRAFFGNIWPSPEFILGFIISNQTLGKIGDNGSMATEFWPAPKFIRRFIIGHFVMSQILGKIGNNGSMTAMNRPEGSLSMIVVDLSKLESKSVLLELRLSLLLCLGDKETESQDTEEKDSFHCFDFSESN